MCVKGSCCFLTMKRTRSRWSYIPFFRLEFIQFVYVHLGIVRQWRLGSQNTYKTCAANNKGKTVTRLLFITIITVFVQTRGVLLEILDSRTVAALVINLDEGNIEKEFGRLWSPEGSYMILCWVIILFRGANWLNRTVRWYPEDCL